jgi:hypothetical protein
VTGFAFGRGFESLVDAITKGAPASLAQQAGSSEGALDADCGEFGTASA